MRRNIPSVKTVSGNVRNTKIGFINALMIPRTIDTTIRDWGESILIPGII